jgi:hypothetical protein
MDIINANTRQRVHAVDVNFSKLKWYTKRFYCIYNKHFVTKKKEICLLEHLLLQVFYQKYKFIGTKVDSNLEPNYRGQNNNQARSTLNKDRIRESNYL